nr:hypothetical protein [Tanacetum cinerariifolium]
MIMPSKDDLYNGRKRIGFENPSDFEKAKDLRPTLYDEKVIGREYTLMFLTHSNEALEIEKFKRSRENKIEFAYDYGNLNANYVNEKINFEDDYFQEIINPDFEKIDSPFQMCDLLDDNNFFIFDDESVKISPVSKMPFRKKPCESMNVRFGNNDFAVIAGYGDVGLEVAFRKSTCFVRNEDGVDLLTGDRSSNLYTIALNEVASNSLTCLLAKASSSQSLLWHQRLSHLNFATINNLVKTNLVQEKPNIKFFRVFGCRCYLLNDYEDVGTLKAKGDIGVFVGYSKESAAFRIYNKRTRKIHKSMNVNFDETSEMASKQFSLEPGLSNLNETGKSSNPSVSQVSETSKKDLEDLFHNFYDEYFDASKIMKSSTTNDETSINEEVFHE